MNLAKPILALALAATVSMAIACGHDSFFAKAPDLAKTPGQPLVLKLTNSKAEDMLDIFKRVLAKGMARKKDGNARTEADLLVELDQRIKVDTEANTISIHGTSLEDEKIALGILRDLDVDRNRFSRKLFAIPLDDALAALVKELDLGEGAFEALTKRLLCGCGLTFGMGSGNAVNVYYSRQGGTVAIGGTPETKERVRKLLDRIDPPPQTP